MLEINFHPFPVLETERLLLRRLTAADVKDVFALRSDKISMGWIPRPVAKTEEDAMAVIDMISDKIDANEGINWGMELKAEKRIVGILSFHRVYPDNHRAEVGYQLRHEYYRRGLMLEALQAIIPYGFEGMKLHSMEAIINPENEPSRRLIERVGFVQEGFFKENVFYHGRFRDSVVYSRLAPS